MNNSAKDTIGCLGAAIGLFLLAWLASSLFGKPPNPPMSDFEMNAIIARQKAEIRQRCINNIRDSIQYMPTEMQKYAREAISKC